MEYNSYNGIRNEVKKNPLLISSVANSWIKYSNEVREVRPESLQIVGTPHLRFGSICFSCILHLCCYRDLPLVAIGQ